MGFGRRLGALAFSGFGGRGRRMLRGDNVSLPHLQQKVILGRVASVNEDGFYTVNTGFKRYALTRRDAPSHAPSLPTRRSLELERRSRRGRNRTNQP